MVHGCVKFGERWVTEILTTESRMASAEYAGETASSAIVAHSAARSIVASPRHDRMKSERRWRALPGLSSAERAALSNRQSSIRLFRLHAFAVLLVEILQFLLLLTEDVAVAELQAFQQLPLGGRLRGRLGDAF